MSSTTKGNEKEWDRESLALLRQIESVIDADLPAYVSSATELQAIGEAEIERWLDTGLEDYKASLPQWEAERRVLSAAVETLIKFGAQQTPMRAKDARVVLIAVYLLWKPDFEAPAGAPGIMRLPWTAPSGELTGTDLSPIWRNRDGVYTALKDEFRELVSLAEHAAAAIGLDELEVEPIGASQENKRESPTSKKQREPTPTRKGLLAALASLGEYEGDHILHSGDVADLWQLGVKAGGLSKSWLVAKPDRCRPHNLPRNGGKGWTVRLVRDTTRALLKELYKEPSPF